MGKRRVLIVMACLAGLAVSVYLWLPFFPYLFARANNDFVCTYAGARLAGNPGLYQVEAVKRVELPLGDSPQFMMYQRFPYYAAAVSPLRLLPYREAYWVWQAVSLAAIGSFLWFWPGQSRWVTLLTCCWSLPLMNCFIMGQDVTLPMAALAIAVALLFRRLDFAAGCVIALCSIKFHLFLTLPLFILTRRMWRFGAGAAAGGGLLLLGSFGIQGWSWPVEYVHMLQLPTSTPSYSLMPNLNGLLSGQPHSFGTNLFFTGLILSAAIFVMWRARPTVALAAMLVSSLLVSYHAFIADAILLIPAGLLILRDKSQLAHRAVGLILLSPLAFIGFRLEHPPFPPAAIVLLPLAVMTATTLGVPRWWRQRRLPAEAPGRI